MHLPSKSSLGLGGISSQHTFNVLLQRIHDTRSTRLPPILKPPVTNAPRIRLRRAPCNLSSRQLHSLGAIHQTLLEEDRCESTGDVAPSVFADRGEVEARVGRGGGGGGGDGACDALGEGFFENEDVEVCHVGDVDVVP